MKIKLRLNRYRLDEFVKVAATFGTDHYAYVVTPNVDHVIRYCDEDSFRKLYDDAGFVLLDSRFLAGLVFFTKGQRLPTCPGSDLTATLFESVIGPDDEILLIGGTQTQARKLSDRYGLRRLRHFNPPMGFIKNPGAIETCLQFIEQASPFRYCLLAVGSPQQEILAKALQTRGRARGLALCVGASINFLTGVERRAPRWMQVSGFEWLYRLKNDPGRLAKRYLVRGPRIFSLLARITFDQQPGIATVPVGKLAGAGKLPGRAVSAT